MQGSNRKTLAEEIGSMFPRRLKALFTVILALLIPLLIGACDSDCAEDWDPCDKDRECCSGKCGYVIQFKENRCIPDKDTDSDTQYSDYSTATPSKALLFTGTCR